MADTLDPAVTIYEGFWTDWTRGRTWGLTWTLSPTKAIILTNSLTLFVAISGVQLWTIVRYILHQQGAPPHPAMATPHLQKQQRILRNAGSDLATARLMLSLAWTTRRSSGKRSLRSYVIGLSAVIYAVMFATAGIFSNKAISTGSTNGGSRVVSRSKSCGVWNQTYLDIVESGAATSEDNLRLVIQYHASLAQSVQLSLEYAQGCYLSKISANDTSSTCNTLKKPRLAWDIHNETREDSCPFQLELCHGQSDILTLETRPIDSHEDLGINSNPKDRLTYQRTTTCAVVNDTGYIKGWDGAILNNSSQKDGARAFFGPSTYKQTDYTYSYANYASFYDNFTTQVTTPYQLDVELTYGLADPQWSLSDFDPILELTQGKTDGNADLTLMFLSFTGDYLGQIDDPWFSAHKAQHFDTSIDFLETRYERDAAISTLGCAEQHRFCTSSGICTDHLGFDQVQNDQTFNNALTPHQNATFDRMLRAVGFSTIKHIVEYLALTTNPLLASNDKLTGASGAVISPGLPDDQWKHELNYWHSIAMAHFQRTLLQWGTGQVAPEPQYVQYLLPATEEQDRWFCKNLIVPSMVFQSFSVLAIILIVVFGTLVIVASLTIERLAALMRRCFKQSSPILKWDDDHIERWIDEDSQRTQPAPLPKDDGYRPGSRTNQTPERSATLAPDSGSRRVSSQELPRGPKLSPVSDRIDSLAPIERTQTPNHRRASWKTISLNSLTLATPEMHNNTSDGRTETQIQRSSYIMHPPPTLQNSNGLGLRNLRWAQGTWV